MNGSDENWKARLMYVHKHTYTNIMGIHFEYAKTKNLVCWDGSSELTVSCLASVRLDLDNLADQPTIRNTNIFKKH